MRNFQPPVSGREVMDTFNLEPCNTVGMIKSKIKEAILEGEIENDRDQALKYMLKLGKELGLTAKSDA